MQNHQALAAHKDGNKSHPLESMTLHGKVPSKNGSTSSTTLVQGMTNAKLIFPCQHLMLEIHCGKDVVHSSLTRTHHVPDLTRGNSNWSLVHGP